MKRGAYRENPFQVKPKELKEEGFDYSFGGDKLRSKNPKFNSPFKGDRGEFKKTVVREVVRRSGEERKTLNREIKRCKQSGS